MLPENLKEHATAAALEAFDASAVVSGKFDRGELTIEIACEKIVSVCGILKYDLGFVRLSTIAGLTLHPAARRFQFVFHLLPLDRKERLHWRARLQAGDPQIDS